VIASDADLEAAMPREHAQCVVLKPHGDYLRETIRNTPEELAELEPRITTELGEAFSRYAPRPPRTAPCPLGWPARAGTRSRSAYGPVRPFAGGV
jgi:hypothetical protein